MSTDINTGLPTLPEGYFWRVNRETVEIRKSLPDSEWHAYGYPEIYSYYVEDLDDSNRETREIDVTSKQNKTIMKWFRKVTITEEVTKRVKQRRYVDRSNKVVEAQTDKNGETTRIPGRYHSAEYRSRYGGYYYSYQGQDLVRPAYTEPDRVIEHRSPVTKENIQSVCARALEKFEALQLLGDYPPKKLES